MLQENISVKVNYFKQYLQFLQIPKIGYKNKI